MSGFVEVSVSGGVQLIRMNRPAKKNAIDRPMYAAMAEALLRAGADEAIGASVIAGVPDAFSAGNDIADFVALATGGTGATAETRTGEVDAFIAALATTDKPLVAAVDGLAIGIGTTMLMHCDLVYATPRSVFRTPFLDLGLVPEAGSSLLAPRLMGPGRAFELLVLGAALDAEGARGANLVTRVVDDAEGAARDAATSLAGKPRDALRIARDLVRGPRDALLERIALETAHFAERLSSSEARAAFAAFLGRPAKG